MPETKEARKERQAQERWQFVDVLRKAGHIVEEEVTVPGSTYVVDVVVDCRPMPHEYLSTFAIEIQGLGFSHLSRKGWLRDIKKAQEIAAAGWTYLPVTWADISSGDALEALARCGVNVTP